MTVISTIYRTITVAAAQTSKTAVGVIQYSRTRLTEIKQVLKTTVELAVGKFYTVYQQVSQEGVSVVEFIQNLFNKEVVDAVGVGDSDDILIGKEVSDPVNLSDTLDRTVQFTRVVTDNVNATDDVNGAAVDDDQVATFFKNTGDQFNLSDSDDIALDKVVGDQFNIGDNLSSAMGFSRSITTDQFNLSDSDDVAFNKQSADSLNISNPGIILNQDYGSDYFFEDYVGISRTIA